VPSKDADGWSNLVLKLWPGSHGSGMMLGHDAMASKARYVLDPAARDGSVEEAVFTNMISAEGPTPGAAGYEEAIVACCRASQQLEEDVARTVAGAARAQVFVHGAIALPAGLSHEGRIRAADRVLDHLREANLPFVAAIQRPSQNRGQKDFRNFHLQFVVGNRPFAVSGQRSWAFAPLKNLRTLGPDGIRAWRELIVETFNEELRRAHIDARYTSLTRSQRGIQRVESERAVGNSPAEEAEKAANALVEDVAALRANIAQLLAIARQFADEDTRLRRIEARRAFASKVAAHRQRLQQLDRRLATAIQNVVGRPIERLVDANKRLQALCRASSRTKANSSISVAAAQRIQLRLLMADSRIDALMQKRAKFHSAAAAKASIERAAEIQAEIRSADARISAVELRFTSARKEVRVEAARTEANLAISSAARSRISIRQLQAGWRLDVVETRREAAKRATEVMHASHGLSEEVSSLSVDARLLRLAQRSSDAKAVAQAKSLAFASLEWAAGHAAALHRVGAADRTAVAVIRRGKLSSDQRRQAVRKRARKPNRPSTAATVLQAASALIRGKLRAGTELVGAGRERARLVRSQIQEVDFALPMAKSTTAPSIEQGGSMQGRGSRPNPLLAPAQDEETKNGPSILEPNRKTRPRRYQIELYQHGLQQASRFDTPIARAGLRDLSVSSLATVQGRREVSLHADPRRDVAPPKAGPLDPGMRRTRGSAGENERRDTTVDNIWDVRPSAEQLERMQSKLFRSPRWRPESGNAAQSPSSADQNSGQILPVGPLLPSASPGEQTSQPGEAAPPSPRPGGAWLAARRKDRDSGR
jgi:hypothetical protein